MSKQTARSKKTLRLVLGDQLNGAHSWFWEVNPHVTYLLMEVQSETGYVKHHVQKICAFFAAMRAFGKALKTRGHRVRYLPLDDAKNRQTFPGNLSWLIEQEGFDRVEFLLPDEVRVDRILAGLEKDLPVPVAWADSEHFLTQREALAERFRGTKRFVMEPFYRHLRKRFDILMNQSKPEGGQWNFDRENRSPYDGKTPFPPADAFSNDVTDIVAMLERMKVKTFGEILPSSLDWPVTREQSLSRMEAFFRKSLPHFGTYQDAMTEKSFFLFHSRLSFALNTKMIHPMEAIRGAVAAHHRDPLGYPIAQVEGFVRQVLGWREYMRGVYWAFMPELKKENFFSHHRPLPGFFWNAKTGMHCLKQVIEQSLRYAWAHHIQRLMITGNFLLLAGIHPDEIDAWYLGIYADAVEWVELPNTRGMSQFADGGKIATKPYVSSANYIRKMSDYCLKCNYDATRRHGDRACPFNSLYWDFYQRHRGRLEGLPRIGMVYRTWDRMDPAEKDLTLAQARHYKESLDSL